MLVGIVIISKEKQSLNTGRFLLLLLCILLALRAQSKNGVTSPGDSTKNKYDINDPRNPHCLCHQYQQLADEEYAKLQSSEKSKMINSLNGELKNPDKNLGKQKVSVNSFWFYHKKRKFSRKNQRAIGKRIMKHKISDELSRCFHF